VSCLGPRFERLLPNNALQVARADARA
jgi:hypothetical protein